MFLRKFQINWPYALGELAIVAVGVLIALGINQWNTERLDRALGNEYLNRLLSDVQADISWSDNVLIALNDKAEALDLLSRAISEDSTSLTNPTLLLHAIPKTLVLAFNAPSVRTATFDDMMSTGRLALVSPISIREIILSYYALGTNSENRLEGRMTKYPHSVFANVPQSTLAWFEVASFGLQGSRPTPVTPPTKFSNEEVEAVLRWLADVDTGKLINAEKNYNSHAIQIIEGGRNRALNLSETIEKSLQ